MRQLLSDPGPDTNGAGDGPLDQVHVPEQNSRDDRVSGDVSQGERESLEGREYRGEDGQIHHHTRASMEQHGGSGAGGREGGDSLGQRGRGGDSRGGNG